MDGGVAQVVKWVVSSHETLSLNPGPPKKKKKKKKTHQDLLVKK
jgi:hypothetical protein